ncbi:hypothetical protein EVB27_101 [Rhizobium phage RHph_TM16]|nr:hypothetical protein EVB27_101 [Rhizobium phage RHph_TM16]
MAKTIYTLTVETAEDMTMLERTMVGVAAADILTRELGGMGAFSTNPNNHVISAQVGINLTRQEGDTPIEG